MTYRPRFVTQFDGSRCAKDNCAIATNVMAMDRHQIGVNPGTGNPWRPTPAWLRNRLTPLGCGGTTLDANAAQAKALYGIELVISYDTPWADFLTVLRAGHGASTRIDYEALHGTRFDHSPNFDGTHQVFVNEIAGDYAVVGDPTAGGWASWPLTLLKKATGMATGTGLVDANFTRDTEPESEVLPVSDTTTKLVTTKAGAKYYDPANGAYVTQAGTTTVRTSYYAVGTMRVVPVIRSTGVTQLLGVKPDDPAVVISAAPDPYDTGYAAAKQKAGAAVAAI